MRISSWPISRERSQAFQAGLSHLVRLQRIPEGLSVHHAFPVYNLELREVTDYAKLGAPPGKLVAWRHFAGGASEIDSVSGDVDLSSTPRVTSLSYGKLVWTAIAAAQKLEELDELESLLKPCVLRIPALLIEAFWLKPDAPTLGAEVGWIVPYHTLLKDLHPAKRYSVTDFVSRINPVAQEALRTPDPTLLKC